jgi:hypothetical protein
MMCDWLGCIAAQHDLETEALAFVSHELETSERELRTSWEAKTDGERTRWLQQCARDAMRCCRLPSRPYTSSS